MVLVDAHRLQNENIPEPKASIRIPNDLKDTRNDNISRYRSASILAQTKEAELYRRNKIDILKRDLAIQHRLLGLIAFVPDLILKDDGSKVPYQLSNEAVVMMADVSGFTALTEAYSLKGKGGTDQLTKTLSSFIGPLAECVLRAGGDIIKYAGDAILATWKVDDVSKYPTEVQKIIDCALFIQEAHGSLHCADVNITVKVKIGIGTGQIFACGIGSENYQHWVVFGPGVEAASSAEHHCVPTDIVVSPQAWVHCNPHHYKCSEKEDGYYKVTAITNFINKDKRGRPLAGALKLGIKAATLATFENFLRPDVIVAKETKTESSLRTYVIPPVFKKLNDDIPLEYLNESRQVCICFIHMDVTPFEKNEMYGESMGKVVQKAFVKIYTQVTKLQGCLTKVIMFDKGLTYLIVFGLPGYINENQSAHALKFSYKIRTALCNIKSVTEVSIGVTTGACYCGVLGHPQRQEYTVLGRKVNKAARLMCNYPNALTCDQDTMYHSKLPQGNFLLMEAKVLKGLANVGKIYEYRDSERGDDHSVPWYCYPILGREGELQYIRDTLGAAKSEYETHIKSSIGLEDAAREIIAGGTWAVVFEGENGIGKTRMLAACMQLAENINIRVFSIGMNLILSEQQLAAVTSLLIQTFQMEGLNTAAEREEHLRKNTSDCEMASSLCLVNELLQMKFPIHHEYKIMDPETLKLRSQLFIVRLIEKFIPDDLILYVIDDAHLMDSSSWEYLMYLSRIPKVIVICSIRKSNSGSPKLSDTVTRMIYHNRNIKVVHLKGLQLKWCLPLVCQLTEVKAIPIDLEHLLITRSKGVPAWCDQVIKQLVQNGTLIIVPYESGSYGRTEMKSSDQKYLTKNFNLRTKGSVRINWFSNADNDSLPSGSSNHASLTSSTSSNVSSVSTKSKILLEEEINPNTRMVVVKPDTNIANISVSGTLKEILLDAFDEVPSSEQMLLKCGSILGHQFSRKMLIGILPTIESKSEKYKKPSFKSVLDHHHFRCVNAHKMGKDVSTVPGAPPECLCVVTQDEESYMKNLNGDTSQRYLNCKFMEFVKDDMMDVVYELMTDEQRRKLHLNAAKYLSSSTVLCPSCGGEDYSYLFGFGKQSTEIGAVDAEQAFRMAATKRKQKEKTKTVYKNANTLGEIRKTKKDMVIASMETNNGQKKRATVLTQLQGLKSTFKTNGTKIAHIELDIFKEVVDFETKESTLNGWGGCYCSCFSRTKQVEDACKLEEELEDEVNQEEIKNSEETPNETSNQNKEKNSPEPCSNTDKALGTSIINTVEGGEQMAEKGGAIDMRTCECAFIQAKICAEMVKHYRFAEKYGKYLSSLLDCAEAVINIGNGNQALVHLEEAITLLTALKNKDFEAPNPDDKEDTLINEEEAYLRIDFLSGMAYFESGVNSKATAYFVKALEGLGTKLLPVDETPRMKKNYQETPTDLKTDKNWSIKLRILTYLQDLFKSDGKLETARLVTILQVTTAKKYGDLMQDIVPSYSNMIAIQALLGNHNEAHRYEKLAIDTLHSTFGTTDQMDAVGLLSTANLFYTLSMIRLHRGSISSCTDASYLTLEISQTIHDNLLTIRILPILSQSLLLTLKITELTECLQKLWYISEEEDEWGGSAFYYALSLEMLLDTAFAMEPFAKISNFVGSSDWEIEFNVFKDFEVQYQINSSMALWYTRYSKWELSKMWLTKTELYKPRMVSYLSVSSELKILQCHLILANHYLVNKRYQHYSESNERIKSLLYTLDNNVKIVPCLKPRLLHFKAYYFRLRGRKGDAEDHLKTAEKLARKYGNILETEWILHSRNVWGDEAIPTSKTFWLDHTEMHVLDWHSGGKVPWVNILYTLPIPDWR